MSGWITSHSPWRPNDDARAVRKEDRLLSPRANHRLKCVSPSRKKKEKCIPFSTACSLISRNKNRIPSFGKRKRGHHLFPLHRIFLTPCGAIEIGIVKDSFHGPTLSWSGASRKFTKSRARLRPLSLNEAQKWWKLPSTSFETFRSGRKREKKGKIIGFFFISVAYNTLEPGVCKRGGKKADAVRTDVEAGSHFLFGLHRNEIFFLPSPL